MVAAPPRRVRRSDSASDQRESASRPLPTPSVIESPIATSALTGRGVDDVDAGEHDPGVDRGGERRALDVEGEVARAGQVGGLQCDRMPGHDIRTVRHHEADRDRPAGLGDHRDGVAHHLGARGDDDVGAAVEGHRLTLPGTSVAPGPPRAAETGPTASGAVPNRLESRTRTPEPVSCGRTTMRSVRPASGSAGRTGCGLVRQAATHPGPHRSTAAVMTAGRGAGSGSDPVAPTRAMLPSTAASRITPMPPPAGTARRPSPTRHLRPTGTSASVPGRAAPLPPPVRPRAAQREESPVREWSERVRFGTRPPSRIVPRHRADGLLSPRPDWPGARRARGRADGRQGGRVRGAVAGQPRRSGDLLARRRAGDRLAHATGPGPRRPAPVLPLVPRRGAERLRERAGPPRRRRARRPDGADLRLARHRDRAPIQLRATARRGRPLRRRAGRARGRPGRPRGRLHADGSRGRHRDAGLRPARSGALGGVRRVRPARARGAHRRRHTGGRRLRVVRHRGQPGARVQAPAGQGHGAGRAQARQAGDPAAAAGTGGDGPGRRRLGRGDGDRRAGRAGSRRGDRPALHPVHLGYHREAEGRGPRQRRLRGGAGLDDGQHLRGRPGRDDVHRVGRRLGRRALLHRLRAAPGGCDHDPLRGQTGRDARRGPVLAGGRRARGQDHVHRAHGVPRDQEGGPEGRPPGRVRPVGAALPLPRGRAPGPRDLPLGVGPAGDPGGRQLVADRDGLADLREPGRRRGAADQAGFADGADGGLGRARRRRLGAAGPAERRTAPSSSSCRWRPVRCRRCGTTTTASSGRTCRPSRATTSPATAGGSTTTATSTSWAAPTT